MYIYIYSPGFCLCSYVNIYIYVYIYIPRPSLWSYVCVYSPGLCPWSYANTYRIIQIYIYIPGLCRWSYICMCIYIQSRTLSLELCMQRSAMQCNVLYVLCARQNKRKSISVPRHGRHGTLTGESVYDAKQKPADIGSAQSARKASQRSSSQSFSRRNLPVNMADRSATPVMWPQSKLPSASGPLC